MNSLEGRKKNIMNSSEKIKKQILRLRRIKIHLEKKRKKIK